MQDGPDRWIRNPGPKKPASNLLAACSTDNSIVTQTILDVLKEGGNAIDAVIAGAMVQAAVEPFMTNHAGTVTCLYYEAATGRRYQLDSAGFLPHDVGLVRTVPARSYGWGAIPPVCCLPGFMPGMKALHERFGTMGWDRLTRDAIEWAEEGHYVSSHEYAVNIWLKDLYFYFPEGRKFYMPDGHMVPVGERFRLPDLAKTLRGVAAEGPDYMITGPWARDFVARANALGWNIELRHLRQTPPRWLEPHTFHHRGLEVVNLALPQQQGALLKFMFGVFEHIGLRDFEPGSAEHLFIMGHALRLGLYHTCMLGDPLVSDYAVDAIGDSAFHRAHAKIIRGLMPKVDLSEHVRITKGPGVIGHKMLDAGEMEASDGSPKPSIGSCELSIVDRDGNWVQLLNTMQTGGIPGAVVGGVLMSGTHANFSGLTGFIGARIAPGARLRQPVGSTIVFRDGQPYFSLGTPGSPHSTVSQVMANLIEFDLDPVTAIDAPRMLVLAEDGSLTIEDRVSPQAAAKLTSMGILPRALAPYDWQMGSFQMCMRDVETGLLTAFADPRRCGVADGIPA